MVHVPRPRLGPCFDSSLAALGLLFVASGVTAGLPMPGTPTAIVQDQETAPLTLKEAQELLERLSKEYDEAREKAHKELFRRAKEAEKEGKEHEWPQELFDAIDEVAAKIDAAAKAHAGTEQAVPFLMWRLTMRVGSGEDVDAAVSASRTIREHHIKSPQLEKLLKGIEQVKFALGDDECSALMSAIEEESPVEGLRATARFYRLFAQLEGTKADAPEFGELVKQARDAAEKTGRKSFRREVDRIVGLATRFAIGMVAPDIDGVDLDGVAFRLSDYEGKVVLLDFWGNW